MRYVSGEEEQQAFKYISEAAESAGASLRV
ncbi:MAG: hypothetical protein ACD_80C00041G0009 [uncultured bacterium (gcode 4)]|uniref:Uncharacterized protein n=1 Tax=uncultured bacterium (gcode 4) TaxID=1234023 RepID=K1X5M3_9BACT|nr:MAG: hypothetical protein ACD_80C00041G0009 [uncultured bacterium (gcode 4)]